MYLAWGEDTLDAGAARWVPAWWKWPERGVIRR